MLDSRTRITSVLLKLWSNFLFFISSFLPWKLFFLAESHFPMNCFFWLICKFRDCCNDDFFQTFLGIFYKFLNFSFQIFNTTHFHLHTDLKCISCHADTWILGRRWCHQITTLQKVLQLPFVIQGKRAMKNAMKTVSSSSNKLTPPQVK